MSVPNYTLYNKNLSKEIYKQYGKYPDHVLVLLTPDAITELEKRGFKVSIGTSDKIEYTFLLFECEGADLRASISITDVFAEAVKKNLDKVQITKYGEVEITVNGDMIKEVLDEKINDFNKKCEEERKRIEEKRREEEEVKKVESYINSRWGERLSEHSIFLSYSNDLVKALTSLVDTLIRKLDEYSRKLAEANERINELELEVDKLNDFREYLDDKGLIDDFVDWVKSKREEELEDDIRQEYGLD